MPTNPYSKSKKQTAEIMQDELSDTQKKIWKLEKTKQLNKN